MMYTQRKITLRSEAPTIDRTHHHTTESSSLIEPYRGELLLHSYRLLGSLHDAEDAVQEAMLRAWRHFDTFTCKGPGSLRTWLYTITTNTCFDTLKKRRSRILPTSAFPEADSSLPVGQRNGELPWLEPFPDSWLAEATENPEARYTRSESVSLAFLAALQLLPPRQRAILLLADVLDWRSGEIAQLIGASVSAVNSALHRARMTLEKHYHSTSREMVQINHPDSEMQALLSRYLHAWENDDVEGLVTLLKEDATFSMPPSPSWYKGRDAVSRVLLHTVFRIPKRWRLQPTYANGQPAFALYRSNEPGSLHQNYGIQVLTLDTSQHSVPQISTITAFLDSSLAERFGFPLQLT